VGAFLLFNIFAMQRALNLQNQKMREYIFRISRYCYLLSLYLYLFCFFCICLPFLVNKDFQNEGPEIGLYGPNLRIGKRKTKSFASVCAFSIPTLNPIGVGDGEGGKEGAPKNGEKILFGQLLYKIRAFFEQKKM